MDDSELSKSPKALGKSQSLVGSLVGGEANSPPRARRRSAKLADRTSIDRKIQRN